MDPDKPLSYFEATKTEREDIEFTDLREENDNSSPYTNGVDKDIKVEIDNVNFGAEVKTEIDSLLVTDTDIKTETSSLVCSWPNSQAMACSQSVSKERIAENGISHMKSQKRNEPQEFDSWDSEISQMTDLTDYVRDGENNWTENTMIGHVTAAAGEGVSNMAAVDQTESQDGISQVAVDQSEDSHDMGQNCDVSSDATGLDCNTYTERAKHSETLPRKNASSVWSVMTRAGPGFAKCTICGEMFRCNKGTSNMLRHVSNKHSDEFLKIAHARNDSIVRQSNSALHKKTRNYKMLPTLRKNASTIWNVMTRIGPGFAKCKICGEKFRCDKGTSNMTRHIGNKHGKGFLKMAQSQTCNDGLVNHSDSAQHKSTSYLITLPRKNASSVWSIMTRSEPGFAKCSICGEKFRCDKGTSNMRRHIINRHNGNTQLVKEELAQNVEAGDDGTVAPSSSALPRNSTQPTVTLSSSALSRNATQPTVTLSISALPRNATQPTVVPKMKQVNKYRPESVNKKAINRKLLQFIYRGMQPFSIVEDSAFQEFCKELDPRYELPSRRQLKQSLCDVYQSEKHDLIKRLSSVESVAISTEAWTSANMQNYLTITAHFVDPRPSWNVQDIVLATRLLDEKQQASSAEGIALVIDEVLEEYNIREKLTAATTDNAPSMIHVVRDYLKVVHVACFAHMLDKVVKDAIEACAKLTPLINRVKEIVDYFHGSAWATAKLTSRMDVLGVKQAKLCLDVGAQWSSTLKMLRRYLDLHRPVCDTLAALNKTDLIVGDESVNKLVASCECLEPFEEAAEMMLAEKGMALSKVLVVAKQLKWFLEAEARPCQLAHLLVKGLSEHFPDLEKKFSLSAATLLDPRFKRVPFSDDKLRLHHEEEILGLMRSLSTGSAETSVTANNGGDHAEVEPHSAARKSKSFMQSFFEKVKQRDESVVSETLTAPRVELQRYFDMKLLDMSQDPLGWWQEHSALLPHLSTVARRFVFVPATSLPPDRLYSTAGELLSNRRNLMKHSEVDIVLFLNNIPSNK